jgi:NADP-dependent 3-hydroxy acid dehydrogenase YdfG
MVWFVTGASSGIGAGAVKAALAAGDRVVAIARNTDKLTKAVGKESESLVHAALDVRNAGQVREAVATALETDDAQGASVVLGARRVDRIQSLATS